MKRFGYLAFVLIGVSLLVATQALALPTPEQSLNTCQDKVRVEGKKALANTVTAVGNCLKKVAIDVLKNNVAITAATSKACVNEFRKINDTRLPPADKDVERKFRDGVDKKCVPGFTPSQTHTFADIMGAGGGTLEDIKTTNINTWCQHFGGDGSVDSVTEWEDCMVGSHNCEAAAAIAAQYPRAAEWISTLITPAMNMNVVPPPGSDPTKTTDAVAGATSFLSVLDPDGDLVNSPRCGGEGVACGTGCCYVEQPPLAPAKPSPDAECFQYTGPTAQLTAFYLGCTGVGLGIGVPASLVGPFLINSAVPGPCLAPSPAFGIPCIPGPPGAGNLRVMPSDSSCP